MTIKGEKPCGYINPSHGKADGFAEYFFEQLKKGDKVNVGLNPNKDRFLSRIAATMEKNIAYWSGVNGAESARFDSVHGWCEEYGCKSYILLQQSYSAY
ncbi:MAG: hypothetical protein L0H53_08110 [Candidatus Nitrosocosmicus sp.]|nr:hypothetical protein [Candidatus Nitrosocosmicus sp.]MDN5867670.1 hypothetical protein [Candidatus Nitrosocosmicus sp.]